MPGSSAQDLSELDIPAVSGEYSELRVALELFGLNEREIDIYLDLLFKGMMKATDISRNLGLHRLDVYNSLKSLQEKEIVTATLSRPMSFRPEPLDKVLEILRKKFGEESEKRKIALAEFETASESITSLLREKEKDQSKTGETIQIISGRKAIGQRWMRVIASATREILIATTSEGTARYLLTDVATTIHSKTKSGVSVRIFTPVTWNNTEPLKNLTSEMRHLATSGTGGLCVIDGAQAMMIIESSSLSGDVGQRGIEDHAIHTTSKSMAAMLRTLFFVGWDTSPTVAEQLGRMAPKQKNSS